MALQGGTVSILVRIIQLYRENSFHKRSDGYFCFALVHAIRDQFSSWSDINSWRQHTLGGTVSRQNLLHGERLPTNKLINGGQLLPLLYDIIQSKLVRPVRHNLHMMENVPIVIRHNPSHGGIRTRYNPLGQNSLPWEGIVTIQIV